MVGFEGVSKFGNVMGLDNIILRANTGLPATLVSFSGKKEGANNILSWTTANELNNKGFEVLRSADGKNYTSIATVESKNANGNSSVNTDYTFVDDKAFAGNNYYQLKQVDKDGKSTLSNIVVLKSITRKLEITTVYPNPATDKLVAIINSDKEEKVTVSITDLVGKEIMKQNINAKNFSEKLNISQLNNGVYFLTISNANGMQSIKFMVSGK